MFLSAIRGCQPERHATSRSLPGLLHCRFGSLVSYVFSSCIFLSQAFCRSSHTVTQTCMIIIGSLPEIHGHPGIISVNYLRVRLRRIERQALRGWLRSAFWTYLFAEYPFPGSDWELQCVGHLLDGIALSSVRIFAVPFTNENTDQFPNRRNTLMYKIWILSQLCQIVL